MQDGLIEKTGSDYTDIPVSSNFFFKLESQNCLSWQLDYMVEIKRGSFFGEEKTYQTYYFNQYTKMWYETKHGDDRQKFYIDFDFQNTILIEQRFPNIVTNFGILGSFSAAIMLYYRINNSLVLTQYWNEQAEVFSQMEKYKSYNEMRRQTRMQKQKTWLVKLYDNTCGQFFSCLFLRGKRLKAYQKLATKLSYVSLYDYCHQVDAHELQIAAQDETLDYQAMQIRILRERNQKLEQAVLELEKQVEE